MQNWWRNFVKDYLTFSARERRGVLIGVLLLIIILAAFRFYPRKKTVVQKDAFQRELAQLKITIDSSRQYRRYQRDDDDRDFYQPKTYDQSGHSQGELFAFDPNTLSAEGWRRLGLREKTIQTLQNFVAKGFKFRRPEDIARIYGLRQEEAQRLIPYVRIAGEDDQQNFSNAGPSSNNYSEKNDFAVSRTRIIEINTADSAAFIALPGIGAKLATRIINFREKLHGFAKVDQISETYGLPDSTFQTLKARMTCNPSAIKKININTAEIADLKSHPYIRWNIANAIVNYRLQHGAYNTIEDLRKIDIISPDVFNKLAPYLTI